GDKYSIDVLRVKAICYSGLEDKAREEEVLKQIITIYPKDIKARCILAKMQRGENASSKMMGMGTMSDCLADDFKQFYENKLVNLSGENFSIEEIAYYYELCLRFGSNEIIKNCTDEYLKCNRFTDVIYDALIDITLDDFKKMLVVERLVLAGVDGECFSLINGMMKKLNLSSIKYLISQFKDTMSESFYDNNEANEPLNNVIDNAFAKAYSLSLLFDIDGAEIANKLGALILYASLHKSDESIDFIKTLYNENNLAFSACILINPQLAKMPKLKKYLGLKNIEIDEIINALKKAGFR
ncbi:MAG: hypothetical protein J6J23_00275, partial [Clostridia bacterium]|nr:hypothetical protein [Clostridia bacterium]